MASLSLNAAARTDHESTSAPEAREKLAKGLAVLIREGSVCKDLDQLSEILDENTSSFVALCTDDRNPLDIAEEGHLGQLDPPPDRKGLPAPSCLSRSIPFGCPHLRCVTVSAAGLARRHWY